MKAEVQITREDFQAFNRYLILEKKILRKVETIAPFALISIIFLLNIRHLNHVSLIASQVMVVIIIYYICFFLFRRHLLNIAYRIPSQDNHILGKQVYTITDQGLRKKTKNNNELHPWEKIKTIDETENYIYIFIAANIAHIIPKRFFSTEDSLKSFLYELHQKVKPRNQTTT